MTDTQGAGSQGTGQGQGSGQQGTGSGQGPRSYGGNDPAGQGGGQGQGSGQQQGQQGGTGQGGSGGSATDVWEDGQPFDAERAKRTIATLREQMRQAPSATAYAELQERVQKFEQSQMTEQQRLEAERDAEKNRAAAAEDSLKTARLENAVLAAAASLNFHNPGLAAEVIVARKDRVEFDKDGRPTNVEALLKDMVAKEPYLVRGGSALDAGSGQRIGQSPGGETDMNAMLRRAVGRST